MGIFDWLRRGDTTAEQIIDLQRKLESQFDELEDVRARLSKTNEANQRFEQYLRVSRSNIPKPIQYSSKNTVSGGDRRNPAPYEGPLYDLAEIARAADVEAYIATSIRKHREQILKEGFSIAGEDQESVDYIENRLFEFALVTGVSFDEVIREYCTNLVQYATGFILKVRDPKASTGGRYRWGGKWIQPMAGLFPMDPSSIGIQQNSKGHVSSWIQKVKDPVSSQPLEKKFAREDVCSAMMDKKTGFAFGTPYVLPVLDDVRTLRRIEEITEIVAQRHAFPWIHWRVGSDLFPAIDLEGAESEVSIVRQIVQNTPPEGGLVTDHRVEADVLGMEGEAIDLEPYLTYYEKRVMAGLRLSPMDLGRTEGAKGNSVTVSETLQDASKDFQSVISNSITHQIFIPLLLEGGFNVTRENIVRLEFKLINREEDRARISHGQDQFLAGTITRNDFRREYLKKQDLTEEEDADTAIGRKEKQEVKLAEMQAAVKADSQAATKKNSNTTRPANQSGKKPAKTRVKANDTNRRFYLSSLLGQWKDSAKILEDYVVRYTGVVEDDGSDPVDITTRVSELDSVMTRFVTLFSVDSKSLLLPAVQDGIRHAAVDEGAQEYKLSNKLLERFIKNNVTKSLNRFGASVKEEILSNDNIAGISDEIHPQAALSGIIENRLAELEVIASKHVDMAYRFGFVKAAKSYGYRSITMVPDSELACENCYEAGSKEVSLAQKDIPYNILLDTHSNCEFSIFFGEK